MDIKNKNIILTGASSGIGKELLKLLSVYEGTKIVAVARHINSIPKIDNIIYPFAADVSTPDGIDSVFEYATKTTGETDIFIANAGFAYLEKLKSADWEHIENIYSLNVYSPIYSLEKMINDGNKTKMFVSTISGAGLVSLPGYSLYCSTKAALHFFMETYRYECNKNLKIMSVYPVATRTEFFDKASKTEDTPLPWPVQEPITVAKAIIKGIRKNKKEVYPSIIFRIFFPIGRALPFLFRLYSLNEKRKVKKWMDGQ
ncbi:MAG: SDR family NAD(P)-dependent oxidoreductase [Dysgonomonas sp.]